MNLSREELLSRLRDMDGHRFEELVADIWRQQGWDATVTSGSGDDGTDVVVKKDSPFNPSQRHVIQAKCYTSKSVGGPALRDFGSAIDLKDADAGVFVTTSSFSSQAEDTAGRLSYKLNLVDGERLCDIILEDLESPQEILSDYIHIPEQTGSASATNKEQFQGSQQAILSQLQQVQLPQMDKHEFKKLVADIWEHQGWETIILNNPRINVKAEKDGRNILIKTDHNTDNKKMHARNVRKFEALCATKYDVDYSYIVTMNSITSDAKQSTKKMYVDLIDGNDLRSMILNLDSPPELLSDYLEADSNTGETDSVTNSDANTATSNKNKNRSTSPKPDASDNDCSSSPSDAELSESAESEDSYKYSINSSKLTTNSNTSADSAAEEEQSQHNKKSSAYSDSTANGSNTSSDSTKTNTSKSSKGRIDYEFSTDNSKLTENNQPDISDESSKSVSSNHPFGSVSMEPTRNHNYFPDCPICGEMEAIWSGQDESQVLKCSHCHTTWEKSRGFIRTKWKIIEGDRAGEAKKTKQWKKEAASKTN